MTRSVLPAALTGAWLLVAPTAATGQSSAEFFETRVRPVLASKCYDCHARVRRGGLRLDSRDAILRGGQSGPAVVLGDADASLLIQVVRHQIPDLEMPVEGDRLTEREIEGLVEWIEMDAPWPDEDPEMVVASADEGLSPSARLFVDRVRPVLERSCFACHTNGESGGLRLDSRERILQGGSRGPAIVPGNAEGSLLISALRHANEDLQMPRNAPQLAAAEIEGIAEWIQSGAEWADVTAPVAIPRRTVTDAERGFWSFLPLTHVDPPNESGWGTTEIDRFIATQYAANGLTPVGPAGKRELIRRATYDLTGLPPTPEEIDEFVGDESEDAFAKVVDRLLESPHYGERWGRHWLDVTRFGEDDTRGLAPGGTGRERYPMAYLHRDWVIDAFNEDMPYDDFVRGHLAADLLEGEKRDELLPGLGFLGQGPWYYDIAEPATARADERHDRVDVTSRAFLGLTVGCARCHDHKYDPIGTHDYYSFAGIFNNANYFEYPLADSAEAADFKAEQEFIEDMGRGLRGYMNTESEQLARVLTLQTSNYMMAAWRVTGREQIPVERAAASARLDLETLQRWIDFLDDEPEHYPFVVPWQEMIADEGGTEEKAKELADEFQRLLLALVAEQEELEELNSKIIARGTPLEEVKSTPMPNGFESFFDQHQLELETMDRERFNLYLDVFSRDLDNNLETVFPKPALLRFSGWGLERQLSRVAAAHVEATREEIDRLREELPDLPFVMGVAEKDSADIEDIALHIRGSPHNLGERVPRSFLHVLDDSPEQYTRGSGRLELAEAIVDHPITARVIVNRVWAWHMGSGIVRSPSNFGFAGEPPTNPELLEYLTKRFVDDGMSIKQLHRDIMLSSVYQLEATDIEANSAVDADNAYFWRFNRQRLSAEAIRDALLHVSGELDDEVGGESLQIDDQKNVRRTVYSEVSRFQVNEYLQTFDFPNPSLTAERRYTTNVPLQSLYFLNSPFVERRAEAFVRRLAKEAASRVTVAENGDPGVDGDGAVEAPAQSQEAPKDGDESEGDDLPETFHDREMIQVAYPLLYGRSVTETEIELALDFLTEQRASWREQGDDDESDDDGEEEASETDEELTPEQAEALAERKASMKAWVQYARALFSAAEFRYIS